MPISHFGFSYFFANNWKFEPDVIIYFLSQAPQRIYSLLRSFVLTIMYLLNLMLKAAVRNLGSEKVLLEGKPEGELYYLLNKIDKGHLHNWMVAALVRYSYTDLLTLVFANIWGPTWVS